MKGACLVRADDKEPSIHLGVRRIVQTKGVDGPEKWPTPVSGFRHIKVDEETPPKP